MTGLAPTLPILARIRPIEGWLEEEEADLLIATATRALLSLPGHAALVEIGSYCGRSTVAIASVIQALGSSARLHAIDPHEGALTADGSARTAPTLRRLQENLEREGLADAVRIIAQRSSDVAWDQPVRMLFIDGLHDYESVSADFRHFDPHVVGDGLVAFHDYADYWPGVKALVDEVVASGRWRMLARARSLVTLQACRA
jgi:predicted O-methyltransferase YrrM